jgi:hypothetical protein
MKCFVGTKPNGGPGPLAYRFKGHVRNPEADGEKIAPLMLRFGIRPEAVVMQCHFQGISKCMAHHV